MAGTNRHPPSPRRRSRAGENCTKYAASPKVEPRARGAAEAAQSTCMSSTCAVATTRGPSPPSSTSPTATESAHRCGTPTKSHASHDSPGSIRRSSSTAASFHSGLPALRHWHRYPVATPRRRPPTSGPSSVSRTRSRTASSNQTRRAPSSPPSGSWHVYSPPRCGRRCSEVFEVRREGRARSRRSRTAEWTRSSSGLCHGRRDHSGVEH